MRIQRGAQARSGFALGEQQIVQHFLLVCRSSPGRQNLCADKIFSMLPGEQQIQPLLLMCRSSPGRHRFWCCCATPPLQLEKGEGTTFSVWQKTTRMMRG